MALRGDLEDLGPIELIQLPATGRRTGELILVGAEHEARLYYEKGNVVHARLGDIQGLDVLVNIVDWQEGEFEFRLGVVSEEKTIEMDLHRAIMQTLKLRDERSRDEAQAAKEKSSEDLGSRLEEELSGFLEEHQALSYICLVTAEQTIVAEVAHDGQVPQHVEDLRTELSALLESHPRNKLNRIIMVDEEGILFWERTSFDFDALLLAPPDSTLGAVSLAANKLVTHLAAVL
jgi:hypothetical protein